MSFALVNSPGARAIARMPLKANTKKRIRLPMQTPHPAPRALPLHANPRLRSTRILLTIASMALETL